MLGTQIRADLTVAMKSGDALRVSVLRMLISAGGYKQIDLQRELTDEDWLGVIKNEAKKRREAIESYAAGGRTGQAESEKKELEILGAYLPKQMDEEEARTIIGKLELPNEFGAAMKMAVAELKGKADGGIVAKIVKEKLNNG